ncbi:MAG: nuclear transport factor 2 family protein [Bacteroidota bacterium]|nr:nuclear transport factor 2 family protein [Bacteroidota bacterium]
MKKGLFLITAGMFLLASCNQSKDASTTTGDKDNTAMNKQNMENHKAVITAIETGDVSKLDTIMSKDMVDHQGNMGRDIVGVDSMKFYLGQMHNFFDGLKMEVMQTATSPDGDYFFATVRMTGKAKANPWGMPVGSDIDDTSVDVVKMKDGKATDHWMYISQKDMMEMMGSGMPPMKKDTMK